MTNRERVEAAFAALSKGDSAPYIDLFDDNVRFEFVGGGSWGGVYQGKQAWREQFASQVVKHIAPPFRQFPTRFLSDGDHLVMEFRTENETRDGRPYHNRYCMIMRFAEGRIIELTEYCDTALTLAVLGERIDSGAAA
jgi:ketosteroid isomerase-like protein